MKAIVLDRGSSVLKCFLFCVVLSLALTAWAIVVQRAGLPYEAYLRDSAIFDVPYAGAISNLGIALMAGTAILAALNWRRTRAWPFLLLFAFATIFALDDGLMLHEALGEADKFLIALYGALFALTYLSFRQKFIWPLLFVAGCFAFSVAMDEMQWIIGIEWVPYYLLEDGAKFCGIVLLFLFALGEWAYLDRADETAAEASV